jgi:hypothetical protein
MNHTKKGVALLTGFVFLFSGNTSLAAEASMSATSTMIATLTSQIQSLFSQIESLKSQISTIAGRQVTAAESITNTLRLGMRHDEVSILQSLLAQEADIYQDGLVTGYFGPKTEAAVRKFQEKYGLASVGIVGPATRAKLNLLAGVGASSIGNAFGTTKGKPTQGALILSDMPEAPDSEGTIPAQVIAGQNRSVKVNLDVATMDTVTLNLSEDVTLTAVKDRIEQYANNGIAWIGHILGEEGTNEVILSVKRNAMMGTIARGNGDVYEIVYAGGDVHKVRKIDVSKLPPHQNPLVPPISGATADTSSVTMTAPAATGETTPVTVDFLAVYSPQARINAGGVLGIETQIINAVAMANQGYINSQINMRINLVHMEEVAYTETGDMSAALTALQSTSDGKIDNVHTLRNQYGADQVSLINTDANYCGVGYLMDGSYLSSAFAPYAFSVENLGCLSNHTMAHEMGHNQGDQHNVEDSSYQGAYPYSYGYRLCQTDGFRTVMSYTCTGATRVNYFSNPNVALSTGQITGTATADNARSMNNAAPIVAAFRSTPSTVVPATPVNLTATAVSSSQINLAWSDMSDNETGFRVDRSLDGITWSQVASLGSNVKSFSNTGLSASTNYSYRVYTYNSIGNSGYSNTASAITNAVPPPDATAPIVNISKPLDRATVSGMKVQISATASDNVGVSSMSCAVDGAVLKTASGSAISCSWNTRKATKGSHTITVTAKDAAGNAGTATSLITLQ